MADQSIVNRYFDEIIEAMRLYRFVERFRIVTPSGVSLMYLNFPLRAILIEVAVKLEDDGTLTQLPNRIFVETGWTELQPFTDVLGWLNDVPYRLTETLNGVDIFTLQSTGPAIEAHKLAEYLINLFQGIRKTLFQYQFTSGISLDALNTGWHLTNINDVIPAKYSEAPREWYRS